MTNVPAPCFTMWVALVIWPVVTDVVPGVVLEIALVTAEQVASVSRTLDVPPERIFPVSAQKGLVAKIQGDRQLLRKSRLGDLERALSHDLIPQQQTLVREHIRRDFDELAGVVSSVGGVGAGEVVVHT